MLLELLETFFRPLDHFYLYLDGASLQATEKHPTNNYRVNGDIQSKSNSKLRNRISKPSTLHRGD
jgi:hypothetical protein